MPPKAKITAEVCSGRRRPKLVHGRSKLSAGKASCQAMTSPTRKPTTPQNTAAMVATLIGPSIVRLLLGNPTGARITHHDDGRYEGGGKEQEAVQAHGVVGAE